MEEIRCPMCSKDNPAENEECQYCGARLKPLEPSPVEPGETGASSPDDESLDWINRLTGLAAGEKETPQPDLSAEDRESAPEVPEPSASEDWLARLQRDIQDAQLNPPAENSQAAGSAAGPSDEDSLPGWLRNVREAASRDTIEPPLGVPSLEPKASDQEDWLERLRNQRTSQAEEAPSEEISNLPAPSVPPEEPDWLHAFPHQKDDPQAESESKSSTGNLPDWLSGSQPGSSGGEDISDWTRGSQAFQPSDIPDWLGSETSPSPESPDSTLDQPAFIDGTTPGEEDLDKPDWLSDLESHAPQVISQPAGPVLSFDQPTREDAGRLTDNLAGEELPDWLASFGPAAAQAPAPENPPAPPAEEHSGVDLAPADVPSWLRAMRPIETVAPSPAVRRESDQREEKTGPLAGLRGTLPAEPSTSKFQRPPSYIARLQPTENQERYRTIFEELIANEKEPQPARAESLISSQRVLKLVIGLLLLVAILIPAVTGLSLLPLPTLLPQETLDMQSAIESLAPDTPVLVAIEYEPSLAGEMESASAGVIDHLMQKGARLAVLSTSPTGPALANRLFDQVYTRPASYQDAYTGGEKLAMLGYLAGGPAGLLDFALRPQMAAPALQDGGTTAWQLPALNGVTGLQDFGLFLLITDDQQAGRTWLEQIQPQTAASAPLLVITSAQAAPVLSAYLDGKQVDGLVSGLAGGTIYEQLRQGSGLSTGRWQAYQLVMTLSLAIILIGTAADLILSYLAARKVNAEA